MAMPHFLDCHSPLSHHYSEFWMQPHVLSAICVHANMW